MACTRTYAGLCIYSPGVPPNDISVRLGTASTRQFDRDLASRHKPNREHNFWLWSTKDLLSSTDHAHHLSAIFSMLAGKESELAALRSEGCKTSISCYWDSDGQGGPDLSLEQIENLHRFGLNIWWDIYFDQGDEDRNDV